MNLAYMVSKAGFLYLLAACRTLAFLRRRPALHLHAAVNEAAEAVKLNHMPKFAAVLGTVMAKTREADRITHSCAAAFAERTVQHHFGNFAHQQVTSNGLQLHVCVYGALPRPHKGQIQPIGAAAGLVPGTAVVRCGQSLHQLSGCKEVLAPQQ